MLVITQERHTDAFLFCPSLLRKWVVAANPVNCRAHSAIIWDFLADATHLSRACAGECHRKKEEQRVRFPEVVTQFDLLRSVSSFGWKTEIGSFGSWCKCHKNVCLV